MPHPSLLLLLALAPLLPLLACAEPADARGPQAARELGTVAWGRDFPASLAEAADRDRPVLVLFQEVPGCATCVGFGEGALSHPLVVEAAETAFVPVAVLNNKPGADREILERYGEPSWNNPVVRFVGADGRDLIPRRDGIYTTRGLTARMSQALAAAGKPVPEYLDWIDDDARSGVERATFETHCFWVGEVCFGSEPGVRATRASWHGGREVVEVWYDPEEIDYATLVARAWGRGCADRVVAHDEAQRAAAARVYGDAVRISATPPRPAPASDQKRHLRRSPLAELPLTRLQQTRVNAALGNGEDPSRWLTPRQRQRFAVR